MNEVEEELKGTKNRSAPGEDGLTYRILKCGGRTLSQHLAFLFTLIMATGHWPRDWKKGIVTMLPKPGKNHKLPASWRPITLLSVLCKLLEKIILKRLQRALAGLRPPNITQAGYKRNRSCQEHLLRLTERVNLAFKSLECVVGVFLDIKGAFDTIWQKGVQYKLLKLGLPKYLVRLIANFLEDRRVLVKVNKVISREIQMRAGTAQGAVLSPEIYKIYTDDTLEGKPDDVDGSQFADDLGCWCRGNCQLIAAEKIQQTLNLIFEWCRKWRMTLAPDKSVGIIFTRRPTLRNPQIDLKLNNTQIVIKNRVKFLGVHLDNEMRWGPHIDELKKNIKFKIYLISKLARDQCYKFPSQILNLFKAIVKPVIDYGSICFINMAACHWNKLNTIYTQALRSFLNIPQYISDERVLDNCHQESLEQQVKTTTLNRLKGIVETTPFKDELLSNINNPPRHLLYPSPLETLRRERNNI